MTNDIKCQLSCQIKKYLTTYTNIFVQRWPRYAVKTKNKWVTKNKPLADRPILAHLTGKYAVAVLGRWYPEYAILDIDDKPRSMVEKIREKLGLNESNSMLFSSESPSSYHLLFRPECGGKPPTIKLLNIAFKEFCESHGIEIYPQPNRPIRLPFGPRQLPLDEYFLLRDWTDKLYWFQKLDNFDLKELKNYQPFLDFEPTEKTRLVTLKKEEARFLFQHGLQEPSSRHFAQFAILYWLWRENIPPEIAKDVVFEWVRKKHNGYSKDIISHPLRVQKEIERQANYIYGNYDLDKIYPDATHNQYYGYISKPDIVDIVKITNGSIPRIKFLFQLVKFCYPRRFKTYINIHTDNLIKWSSERSYLSYLTELENKGILKRKNFYQPGAFSKTIKLNWHFRTFNDAIVIDGRTVDTFEDAARLIFEPREFKELLEGAGASRQGAFDAVERIWSKERK